MRDYLSIGVIRLKQKNNKQDFSNLLLLAPRVRLERTTYRLTAERSTN